MEESPGQGETPTGLVDLEKRVLEVVDPMAVREFTVRLVTDPLSVFPELWEERVVVDEERYVEHGRYWYVSVRMYEMETLRGRVEASAPVDVFVINESNYLRFKWGRDFRYFVVPSRESVLSFSFEWSAPREDTYYIVIRPVEEDARVQLRLTVAPQPMTPGFPESVGDRSAWYIWIVNAWVAHKIHYVSDPNFELVQTPQETLRLRAGDCDDVAVLMASMYQAVGLETRFALVDTDGDGEVDHITVLVKYEGSSREFLDSEEIIVRHAGLMSRMPGTFSVSYLKPKEGDTGYIWIIADPLFSESPFVVGMIEHEPYELVRVFP